MNTNIWDFACKRPIIFTVGVICMTAIIGNALIYVIDMKEKENNDEH